MGNREEAEVVLYNIGQLVTMAGHTGKPVVHPSVESLGIVESKSGDLCVAGSGGEIVYMGRRSELHEILGVGRAVEIDCKGKLVTPGFVDSHTHCIFAGSRENELSMKLAGMTYNEILASGGGILKTVRDTRKAQDSEIISSTEKRIRSMRASGTTTLEAKSGYALNLKGDQTIGAP